ncbi:hypothetical protein CCO04_27215 [Pimelobacter sp. 30-1]|nr:hypothetical protein [Pimelobacter sp. 30-1]
MGDGGEPGVALVGLDGDLGGDAAAGEEGVEGGAAGAAGGGEDEGDAAEVGQGDPVGQVGGGGGVEADLRPPDRYGDEVARHGAVAQPEVRTPRGDQVGDLGGAAAAEQAGVDGDAVLAQPGQDRDGQGRLEGR